MPLFQTLKLNETTERLLYEWDCFIKISMEIIL